MNLKEVCIKTDSCCSSSHSTHCFPFISFHLILN